MHQAELIKLFMVVNTDEDLAKTVMEAGDMNNGHLLHQFKDIRGEMRQSFYSLQAQELINDDVKDIIIGRKRTSIEAGFSDEYDMKACSQAIQLQHYRDYALSEIKGGSKGETADYLLYDTGRGDTLQFVPVTSKIRLHKKRKANAEMEAALGNHTAGANQST